MSSSLPAGVRPPPSTAPLASTATPYSDVADAVTETTASPTLKVMRLQKPSLHTPTAGTISASSSLMQTAMCLPDSFGTISVGETFRAYLGALNTSRSKNVVELRIVAQLQTPSQRYQLVLKNKNKRFDSDSNEGEGDDSEGGGLNVEVVPPLECVDSIVSHGPLQEQGQHILRVEVSYVQVMGTTPQTSGGGGNNFITQSTTTTKSIRKFYRFQVTSPLSLGQEIWRRSDEDVFVSIEIKNTNNPAVEDSEGMAISSATFEPPPPPSSSSSSAAAAGTTKRRCPRILLGVTGSVAAVKAPEIAVRLQKEYDADVKILLTRGGENFWTKAAIYDPRHWSLLTEELESSDMVAQSSASTDGNNDRKAHDNHSEDPPRIHLHRADDEWKSWQKLGDPVLHIDLRNWADVLVVAPLSAHILSKFAGGLCDDTLSCVVRAWDFGQRRYDVSVPSHTSEDSRSRKSGKPIILAPAMNTYMWQHPLTQSQLDTVQNFSNNVAIHEDDEDRHNESKNSNASTGIVRIIAPQVKTLACGEIGDGALASVDSILQAVKDVCEMIQ